MPLVINDIILKDSPATTRSLFDAYPYYKEGAANIKARVAKQVGPVALLYVSQREFAVVSPHDKYISIIGSDDATTCIIGVLRHTGSGVIALAHFDKSSGDQSVSNFVSRVFELSALTEVSGRLELHLVGGFLDNHSISERLACNLLYQFHKESYNIHLLTACICEQNNTIRANTNWPMVYGVGVNTKTGELFPAMFPDKGPDIPLRFARHLTGGHEMMEIYDFNHSLLKIGPFHYAPIRCVDMWLGQADDFILQHLSTSPEVEGPDFVTNIRATLMYIKDNPFPFITVFPSNESHYYQKHDTGVWLRCQAPPANMFHPTW